ncbi:hypothetical protein BDP27DRAFT_1227391 [Rhodocollybia butyracea]|uniref:Uncharacterized protein n=1 Tax=Rhodocollybia butyracea TaxID=206335 RepID=A0A9P5U5C4_9AGAR|nr:hypothetical protein BDP27DRAFT_1227391 [Rhodocollybia butyracea]
MKKADKQQAQVEADAATESEKKKEHKWELTWLRQQRYRERIWAEKAGTPEEESDKNETNPSDSKPDTHPNVVSDIATISRAGFEGWHAGRC